MYGDRAYDREFADCVFFMNMYNFVNAKTRIRFLLMPRLRLVCFYFAVVSKFGWNHHSKRQAEKWD